MRQQANGSKRLCDSEDSGLGTLYRSVSWTGHEHLERVVVVFVLLWDVMGGRDNEFPSYSFLFLFLFLPFLDARVGRLSLVCKLPPPSE